MCLVSKLKQEERSDGGRGEMGIKVGMEGEDEWHEEITGKRIYLLKKSYLAGCPDLRSH